MATLPTEPIYSTHAAFIAHTRVAAQRTITEEDWTPYALHAEFLIDSYVNVVDRYSDDQVRLFPIMNSIGESEMPINVQKAHIELVSWLILKGEPKATDEETTGKTVDSESWRSTEYTVEYFNDGSLRNQNGAVKLPSIVIGLLAEWCPKSAKIKF